MYGKHLLFVLLFVFLFVAGRAQTLLERKVSLKDTSEPLRSVLHHLEEQGAFFFSYNSDILNRDSLVTISMHDVSLKEVLQQLLGFRYVFNAHGRYVIIRQVARDLLVTGLVNDEVTGEPIADATVFSREQLRSVFTGMDGRFSLLLKGDRNVSLGVGRIGYRDTVVPLTGGDGLLQLYLSPANKYPDSIMVHSVIPHTLMGRLLLSSRQRLRNINLRRILAERPFQLSLLPGISTSGKMNGQVESTLSLNIVGGYTAGVWGAEIGGLFNLNRGSAGYLQVAGLLNATGGSFTGLQVALAHNDISDTLRGVQAGLLLNYTRVNRGVQVGLINASEHSTGIGLGLLNFVRDGSRRLVVYTSDLVNTMIAYKTGNRHFYNIVLAGNNTAGKAISAIGLGMGYDYAPVVWGSLSAEVNYQAVKLDTWKNKLMQAKVLVNLYPFRSIGLFGGPVFNRYINYDRPEDYMKSPVSMKDFELANAMYRKAVKNWIGWEAGVSFETACWRLKLAKRSTRWSFAPGFSLGRELGSSKWLPGGDIALQKAFARTVSVMVSGGYMRIHSDGGIPFIFTAKFFAAGPFYVAGSTGQMIGTGGISSSLTSGVSAGFQLQGGADFSAGYEHFHQLHIEQLQLRGRYHFKIF